MAQTYTINGTDYSFPDVDDSDWGQNVTDWAGAVSSFLLQRSGGTFTLGAVVDFGTGYGLKIKDLESKTSNASTDASAFLRMAKGDYISWRNNAEGADLALKKNTSDRLEFATKELINVDAAQTMSSKTLTSPVINTGISGTAIDDNTSLGSSATKVPTQNAVKSYVDAQLTASDLDFSGDSGGAQSVDLDSQSLTVEGGTGVDTTGSAQKISIAIDSSVTTNSGTQTLTNKTLTSPKVNEDVVMTTTSTYLNRMDATSNVQAQIDSKQATITGAATTIASSDLTASKVLQSNGSGKVEASTVTTTTLGYLDATSSVQTQLDAKAPLASPYFTTYADFDSQGSAPAAPTNTGDVRLYAKDSKFYFHPEGGSATEVGSGGGAGDADTIQLKTAEASEGTGSAPWYTGNDLVPGGGGSIGGTWELSTSNPLINTNDATKVFHYSNGTSNRKGDYFEIELDVPNYAKGHNLVVQLFYRTVGAEDTDFLFFARDRTADYSTETSSAQGATNNVAVDSSTGFAVGDRICFEDSSNARHFRYVTAVPDGTHVTFSGAAAAFDDAAAIVTKFFTDELDYITAENNTTNYEGKIRKWAFQINDTTTKIRVGFLYDNSATSTNELFFDQILLSSNQFLQTSSQGQSESGLWYGRGGTNGFGSTNNGVLLPSDEGYNTISETGTVELSATLGWSFTANQRCSVNMNVSASGDTASIWLGISKNATGSALTTAIQSIPATQRVALNYQYAVTGNAEASFSGILEKGDILRPGASLTVIYDGTYDEGLLISLEVTPLVNDVVLLNSQDEIFTDWQDYGSSVGDVFYTTSWAAGGANTVEKAVWRRIGSEMELKIDFVVAGSGTVSTDYGILRIPSGYTIDKTKIGGGAKTILGTYYKTYSNSDFNTTSMSGVVTTRDDYEQYLYLSYQSKSDHTIELNSINAFANHSERFMVNVKIPIQGWTSTFNPVLSMPLVDFGSFENVYSARIAANGTVTSMSSESWISSVADDGTGLYTINFKSGLFSVAPAVIFTMGENNGTVVHSAVSTSSTNAIVRAVGTSTVDSAFVIAVQRQGSDYRQQPQPTAAVIKPAVCILKDVKANNDEGGSSSAGLNHRDLNTIEGESWFVTLSSNQFTLEPGMYKIDGTTPGFRTGAMHGRLYDITNSKALMIGSSEVSDNSSGQGSVISRFGGVITITSSTTFKVESYSQSPYSTYGLGYYASPSSDSSVYTQVFIEKLK